MKFKRMQILSLCLILCLLSGCKNQNSQTTSITSQETTSPKMGENKKESTSSEEVSGIKEKFVNILRNDEEGLQIEKSDEKSIVALMKKIDSEGSFSAPGHDVSLDDVREFVSLPQWRMISLEGSNGGLSFYSAHDSASGGRLFVFYGQGQNVNWGAYYSCFIQKTLYFKDFDGLIEGSSTLEEVENIDPAVKINFFNRDDEEPNHYVSFLDQCGMRLDYDYYSVHATKDGIVNIGYRKKGNDFVVHLIYKLDISRTDSEIHDPVAAINENDWP